LQDHRTAFLAAAEGKYKALIVGDGDGRFLQALVNSYPHLEIDSLELSGGMLAQARRRVSSPQARFIQGDVFAFDFELSHYEVLFTHFFLDCFTTANLSVLVTKLSATLTPDAIWIVSEFRSANRGWRKFYTSAWLAAMYCFFGFATGLKTKSLPDYATTLANAGFAKRKEMVSTDGLIASQWWERHSY
jgi:ubiquinone/menaquinone biosynthesis C-methylase UbiE